MKKVNPKSAIWCSLFLLCLTYSLISATQISMGRDYTVKVWSVENGLPQNSILCIFQDSKDYIWIGTRQGLVRFDGIKFTHFNRGNTPQLKSNEILSVGEDRHQTIWIGTPQGLTCLKNQTWNYLDQIDGKPLRSIRDFCLIPGGLVGGCESGLFKIHNDEIQWYMPENTSTLMVNTLFYSSNDDSLWLGTEQDGVFFYNPKDGLQQIESIKNESIQEIQMVNKKIWIGSDSQLFTIKKGSLKPFTQIPFGVKSICITNSGGILIGTDGDGIFLLNRDSILHFSVESGFIDDYIWSMLKDREGNLWIGTFTSGILKMRPTRVQNLHLPPSIILSLGEGPNGVLWVGTKDKGLIKYQRDTINGRWSKRLNNLSSNRVHLVFCDGRHNLWVGTDQGGLEYLSKDKYQFKPISFATQSPKILSMHEDENQTLWMGSRHRLYQLDKGNAPQTVWEQKDAFIHEITRTSSGALLLGTQAGLFEYDAANTRQIFNKPVLCVLEDERHSLWIGTGGEGLYIMSNGTIERFPSQQPWNTYIIHLLSHKDHIWVSSSRGVVRINKQNQQILHLTDSDGMRSSECSWGGFPSSILTDKGSILCATIKGVVEIIPHQLTQNPIVPHVSIEQIIADNVSLAGDVEPLLNPNTRVIEFYFTAPGFTDPEKMQFKYQLQGFHPEWKRLIPGQTTRAALYINLDPGSYIFRVKASNNDSLWNETGVEFRFRIKSPFLGSLGFYLLLMGIFLLVLFGVLRFFLIKRKRKIEKYQTSTLDSQLADQLEHKLIKLMEEGRVFLNADLSLQELAGKLGVHYNHLSRIINERMGMSFNDYINQHRINEAKRRLCNPEYSSRTILEIAYDCGFYSKSVFNTAFKKFCGQTPSQFRKSQD